jgi:hypothetical protein
VYNKNNNTHTPKKEKEKEKKTYRSHWSTLPGQRRK